MKRQLIFGTMLSAALAVGVAAQQPPASGTGRRPRQTPSERPQSSAVDDLDRLSAGGDRLRWRRGRRRRAPGSNGTAGASRPGGGFVLTDVKPAGSMAGGSTAPWRGNPGSATGTTGTGAARAGGASGSVDLSPDGWRQSAAVRRSEGRGDGNGCLGVVLRVGAVRGSTPGLRRPAARERRSRGVGPSDRGAVQESRAPPRDGRSVRPAKVSASRGRVFAVGSHQERAGQASAGPFHSSAPLPYLLLQSDA